MNNDQLAVYRFKFNAQGKEISPGHMWGTLEAISVLADCQPLDDTRRHVARELLDMAGFYYEEAPGVYQAIDTPTPHYAR